MPDEDEGGHGGGGEGQDTRFKTPDARYLAPDVTSPISRRIAAISDSATMAITARAAALRAAGRPVIGFGVGEPDFPTPEHIVAAAQQAAADPRAHNY